MIKNELEYKECPVCKKTVTAQEASSMILYGFCKDCLIERLKCCENCADYDGQDCDADNENCCRCFTGDKNDDCYWRLAKDFDEE
ncbi:MAG: hypothetical protein L6V86_08580 [Treponema sp.]|nr:MAG: hypothetical protein L6V86_08580 [Treponema sp.]